MPWHTENRAEQGPVTGWALPQPNMNPSPLWGSSFPTQSLWTLFH